MIARPLIFDADSTQKHSVLKHRSFLPTTNARAIFSTSIYFNLIRVSTQLMGGDVIHARMPLVSHKGRVKRALIVKHISQMERGVGCETFLCKKILLPIFLHIERENKLRRSK